MNKKLNNFINKLLVFTSSIVNLYMYYVGIACLLSWIPNINPNYPLFHTIFLSAGFYLLPPVGGFVFAPIIIMTVCVLISQGLDKLYFKLNKDKKPEIIVMTPEEFFDSIDRGSLKLSRDKETKDKTKDKDNKEEENKDDGV